MKSRFRLKESDTVKAVVCDKASGKLLASLYNSGFGSIGSVVRELLGKVPYTSCKLLDIRIYNLDKEESICLVKRVNK